MSDSRPTRGRLDTPREQRRLVLRRPDPEADTIGVFAEGFARYMGTARFLFWMTVFVGVWIGWNIFAPAHLKFDRYPFIFLTLMLSLQASYAAPLSLLAQNRQETRDKVVAEQDRQANARAHADIVVQTEASAEGVFREVFVDAVGFPILGVAAHKGKP